MQNASANSFSQSPLDASSLSVQPTLNPLFAMLGASGGHGLPQVRSFPAQVSAVPGLQTVSPMQSHLYLVPGTTPALQTPRVHPSHPRVTPMSQARQLNGHTLMDNNIMQPYLNSLLTDSATSSASLLLSTLGATQLAPPRLVNGQVALRTLTLPSIPVASRATRPSLAPVAVTHCTTAANSPTHVAGNSSSVVDAAADRSTPPGGSGSAQQQQAPLQQQQLSPVLNHMTADVLTQLLQAAAFQSPSTVSNALKRGACPRYTVLSNGMVVPYALLQQQLTRASSLSGGADQNERYKSPIECGIVVEGKRQMFEYSPFFGCTVEVFTATMDTHKPRRTLYKASLLAHKFGCATNKLAMYLSRRRCVNDGIFQATMFIGKPNHSAGLKSTSYLVTAEACKEFAVYFNQRKNSRAARARGRNRQNARNGQDGPTDTTSRSILGKRRGSRRSRGGKKPKTEP